jgi:hypothetical protein
MLKNSKMLSVKLSFDRLRTGWLSLTKCFSSVFLLRQAQPEIKV